MRLCLPLLLWLLLMTEGPTMGEDAGPFRYAYYLFEAPGGGGADTGASYIPLLVTRKPLGVNPSQEAAVIITYERDSVWKLRESLTTIGREAVEAKEGKLRWEGKSYRYQAVPGGEVVRLLTSPGGQIPTHRREPPISRGAEALRRQLMRELSGPAGGRGGADRPPAGPAALPPAVTLHEALRRAEAYVKERQIVTENKYLASVRFHPRDGNERWHADRWEVTWRSTDRQVKGGWFAINVYMDRAAEAFFGE